MYQRRLIPRRFHLRRGRRPGKPLQLERLVVHHHFRRLVALSNGVGDELAVLRDLFLRQRLVLRHLRPVLVRRRHVVALDVRRHLILLHAAGLCRRRRDRLGRIEVLQQLLVLGVRSLAAGTAQFLRNVRHRARRALRRQLDIAARR